MQKPQHHPHAQQVHATSLDGAARQLRNFLIWVLLSCIYYTIAFQPYFLDIGSQRYSIAILPMWSGLVFSVLIMTWMSKTKRLTIQWMGLLCKVISFLIGASLAISVYLFLALVYHHSQHQLHLDHFITLCIIPMSILYIMGLLCLTMRVSYFLLFFIPSILPFILFSWVYLNTMPEFFSAFIAAWAVLNLVLAIFIQQLHRRLNSTAYQNQKLQADQQIQIQNTQDLEKQYQLQLEKLKHLEQELVQSQQSLQQRILANQNDRTKIYNQLILEQANLKFTHEATGLNSWLWHVDQRRLEVNFGRHDLDLSALDQSTFKIESMIHPDDLALYKTALKQHLRGLSERFEISCRVQIDGQWHWTNHFAKVISREGKTQKPLIMVGLFKDIQKERSDQERVKLSANIFNQVSEGIFVLDSNLCYLDVNPYYEKLIGFNKSQLINKHLFDITHNHRAEIQQQHLLLVHKLRSSGRFDSEVQEEYSTGKKLSLWMHINSIQDDRNQVTHYVGITTDLTDQKKQEQRLSYLENYDLLTDLPNRFYFHLKLHHYINHRSALHHYAVIRINIDRFRLINEFLDNNAGDALLKLAAQRLRSCCKEAELVSYFNNDDFAVLMNLGKNSNSIHALANSILLAFQQAFVIDDKEQNISISIGIALYPEHTTQINNLINYADMALANAKRLGGNTISFYNHRRTLVIDDHNQLKHDLKNAIKNNQLTVYYQPQICSKQSTIIGFEALVRWCHPLRGLISPETFIPFAEETSLISEIGQFVIFESCKQLQIWRELGFEQISVSVNIVAQQIHRGHLLIDLDTAMSMYQVEGHQLSLEITESSLLDQSDAVINLLKQIRQRNISISLDDFGTGYSSLAYLSIYPIDTLKIDKAFVSKIGVDKEGAIVDAIIAMARSMGIAVIAEGVETRQHVEYLKKLDCDVMQGFYFSKPLNATESTLYLNQFKSSQLTN